MNKRMMRHLYMVPYVVWILVFVIAPILLVLYYSFFDIHGNFSFVNYERFFTPVYLKLTVSSFLYAFLITFISLLVAYPTACLLTKTKHKQLWLLLIIVPSWINLLLKAYAFIGIFGAYGAANQFLEFIGVGARQLLFTDFSFVFVAVYIFIPFMILPIFNALNGLNPALVDAANDLGATKWTTFVRVIFPLTIDGVKTGCQVVFIPAPVHVDKTDRRQSGHYTRHSHRTTFSRYPRLGNGFNHRRIFDSNYVRHDPLDRI